MTENYLDTYILNRSDNYNSNKEYEVLVLSGGGVKGVVHLGMLHQIHKYNKLDYINHYVGTSIGSITCLFLCIGFTPFEIFPYTSINTKICLDFQSIIHKHGAMSCDIVFNDLFTIIEKKLGYIPTMKELFEETGKDFTCITYNITKDETVYLNYKTNPNLSCIEAVKMSCNLPLVFEKYIYDKCFYIDGGVSDNYGISYANETFTNKKILGLNVEKKDIQITETKNGDLLSYVAELCMLSFKINRKISKNFKPSNGDSITVILKEELPDLKLNLTSILRYSLFSMGIKISEKIWDIKEKND